MHQYKPILTLRNNQKKNMNSLVDMEAPSERKIV